MLDEITGEYTPYFKAYYEPNGSTEHDHMCHCPSCNGDEPDEDDNPLDGRYCPACGEHLEEGHVCAEIDVLAQAAWNDYKSGICPCGDAECDGIEWLLNGKESFEMLEVDL